MHGIGKREFLAGLGATVALAALSPAMAQRKTIPNRMAKTTRLFKAPGFFPNALAVAPEGLWVQQQLKSPGKEAVWLLDWNGNVLRTLHTDASNGSGLAYGGGSLWVMANTTDATTGVYQIDAASGKQIARRQLPLSPQNSSGGIHGAQWHDGKLWVVSNRMRSITRMDPKSWKAEIQFPVASPLGLTRFHDITFDKDGTLLQVIANESTGFANSKSGLVRYNPLTGEPIETITMVDGAGDPHGLEIHNGRLISCDAGNHPGWKNYDSANAGWIFAIDII